MGLGDDKVPGISTNDIIVVKEGNGDLKATLLQAKIDPHVTCHLSKDIIDKSEGHMIIKSSAGKVVTLPNLTLRIDREGYICIKR